MPVFASIAQSGNDELAFIERGVNAGTKEGDVVVRENPEKTGMISLQRRWKKHHRNQGFSIRGAYF